MSWIRIDRDIRECNEFLQIVDSLADGSDLQDSTVESIVLGFLVKLWAFLDIHGTMDADGHGWLHGMSPRLLNRALNGVFNDTFNDTFNSLLEVGWVEIEDGGIVFPNVQKRWPKGFSKDRSQWASEQGKRSAEARRQRDANVSFNDTLNDTSNDKPNDSSTTVTVTETDKAPIAGAMGVESGDSPPPSCPIVQIVGYWNEVLGQRVRDTNKRKTAIRARWKDEHFRANWAAAIRKVSQSAFCMGQNDRDWVATLDWFLRPDTVTKIMEGTYDDRASLGQARGAGSGTSKAEQRDQRLAQALSDFVTDPDDIEDDQGRIRGNGSDPLRIETPRRTDQAPDDHLVEASVAVRHEDDSGGDLETELPF